MSLTLKMKIKAPKKGLLLTYMSLMQMINQSSDTLHLNLGRLTQMSVYSDLTDFTSAFIVTITEC